MKTRPCSVSSIPLLPMRRRFSSVSNSASPAISTAFTSRCAPLSTSVMMNTARRAARSVLSVCRISSFTSAHLLDIDADSAAAGQADLPGGLVGDAEFEHFRLAAFDHVDGLGHHRALDATARHRAEEIAFIVDHQIGADRPRRRTAY